MKHNIVVKDDWEIDSEEEDEFRDAEENEQIKLTEEDTKKLEERRRTEESERELIQDLFVRDCADKKPIINDTDRKPVEKTRSSDNVKKQKYLLAKHETEQKQQRILALNKKTAESRNKKSEIFGETELDELQDRYCDMEDMY